jgi:hypothetical protein
MLQLPDSTRMQTSLQPDDSTTLAQVTRKQVFALEREIQKQPPVEFPIRHYFAPGLYAREITIRKGYVLTGAVHKTENLAVLSAGRLLLVTENGVVEVAAPHSPSTPQRSACNRRCSSRRMRCLMMCAAILAPDCAIKVRSRMLTLGF